MTAEQLKRRQEGLESPARVLGAQIGQEKVPADIRSNRSAAAGNAVLQRFGQDFYSSLGKLSAKRRRNKSVMT